MRYLSLYDINSCTGKAEFLYWDHNSKVWSFYLYMIEIKITNCICIFFYISVYILIHGISICYFDSIGYGSNRAESRFAASQ